MSKFFTEDPRLIWTRGTCPVCNNPTGPESKCYELPPAQKLKLHQRNIVHPKAGILPVFTQNCAFREEETWKAEINYPFSEPLLNRLSLIVGVERIFPLKPYSFQVSIGRLFDSEEVRKEVVHEYKAFIKEMQAKELELDYEYEIPALIGVTFPNGEKYEIPENLTGEELTAQLNYVKNILETIPDSSGIYRNN